MRLRKRPSFNWRILAHFQDGEQPSRLSIHSRESAAALRRWKKREASVDWESVERGIAEYGADQNLERPCEFDELVLGNWLHIEQLNDDTYYLGLYRPGDGDADEIQLYARALANGKVEIKTAWGEDLFALVNK